MTEGRVSRVVVIGAGPAGLATALALRQQNPGLSVIVLERPRRVPQRTIETLPPTAEPLLKRLGVWEAFLRDGHHSSYSSACAWGTDSIATNEFVLHPYQRGWHLDRARLDAMLAREAIARGIEILPGTISDLERRKADGWRLTVDLPGQSARELEAGMVVDATGRSSWFARRQGACRIPGDRLVGAVVYLRSDATPTANETRSLLEASEFGWWFTAGLSGGRHIAAFMTDDDLARRLEVRNPARWQALLDQTRHVRARLAGAKPCGDPGIHPAQSACLDVAAGDGWLAVGDAASSLDPLSSMGIFKALRSALLASYAIRDFLHGVRSGLGKYANLMRTEYEGYLETRERFYREETRWAHSAFWRRRTPVTSFADANPGEGSSMPGLKIGFTISGDSLLAPRPPRQPVATTLP